MESWAVFDQDGQLAGQPFHSTSGPKPLWTLSKHPKKYQQPSTTTITACRLCESTNSAPKIAAMKIINASPAARKPLDRTQYLDLEIQRLEEEIGVNEPIQPISNVYIKQEYFQVLENFNAMRRAILNHQKFEQSQQHSHLQRSAEDRGIRFNNLPTELRLKIWELAFASHTKPRVHCVNLQISKSSPDRETFISNHAISPILHVNRESRSYYFHKTQLTFAFETYINLDSDIVYIPELQDDEADFRKFLDFKDSRKVQKLALRKDFFNDIPIPGQFPTSYLGMRRFLSEWKQIVIIFEDELPWGEVWTDLTVKFKEFSSREKRKKAERSYTRKNCQVLNGMMEEYGEEPMDFRFGYVRSNEA
jgi:hypothetical protein